MEAMNAINENCFIILTVNLFMNTAKGIHQYRTLVYGCYLLA